MYYRQFHLAAIVNDWLEDEKATFLVLSLRDQAFKVLLTIPERRHIEYRRITEELQMSYGQEYLQQVYQKQVKCKCRNKNVKTQTRLHTCLDYVVSSRVMLINIFNLDIRISDHFGQLFKLN